MYGVYCRKVYKYIVFCDIETPYIHGRISSELQMVESTPFNFNIINIQHQQLDLNINITLNYPEVSRPISILNHRTYCSWLHPFYSTAARLLKGEDRLKHFEGLVGEDWGDPSLWNRSDRPTILHFALLVTRAYQPSYRSY